MEIDSEHFRAHRIDVDRIVDVFACFGLVLDPRLAYEAWCAYSERYEAGWLFLPDSDEDIYNHVARELQLP